MNSPVRVQLRRTKGWKMPENTVKVDRTTKWGNPFKVDDYTSRFEAVEAFRGLLNSADEGELSPRRLYPSCEEIRSELAGKNLACWCKLPVWPDDHDLCHADVLLELANAPHTEDR